MPALVVMAEPLGFIQSNVARRTAIAQPCSTTLGAVGLPRTAATEAGHAALTLMMPLASNLFASLTVNTSSAVLEAE